MNKQERRAYQDGLESDMEANARPNIPPSPRPAPGSLEYCGPSRTGRHDFSMKGSDGKFRCWYCTKSRAQVEEEGQAHE